MTTDKNIEEYPSIAKNIYMDIPVIDLKNLKKYFYYFLAVAILILLGSIAVLVFTSDSNTRQFLRKINSWYIIIAMLIVNYLFGLNGKKELKNIQETTDLEEKFNKYEKRFRKRLVWNAVSIAFTGILLILDQRDFFLYILIIQVLLAPAFYPRKSIISKELRTDEIVFI